MNEPSAWWRSLVPWRSTLALYLVFATLVARITGDPGYALGVVQGPMAGGALHDWRSCCVESAQWLLPYGACALGLRSLVTLFVLPRSPLQSAVRLAAWGAEWSTWLATAVLSYMHGLL